METLRTARGLYLGVVAILGVSLGASWAWESAVASDDLGSIGAVQVPVGKHGDVAAYGVARMADGKWVASPQEDWSLRINGTRPMIDRYGDTWESVVMESTRPVDKQRRGTFNQREVGNVTYRTYAELGSRLTVADETYFERWQEGSTWSGYRTTTTTVFGPFPSLVPQRLHGDYVLWPQGARYVVGTSANQEATRYLQSFTLVEDVVYDSLDYRGHIVASSPAGEHQTVALQLSGCVTLTAPNPDRLEDGRIPFLHFLTGPGPACFEARIWFSSQVPYPILFEETLTTGGASVIGWRQTLTSYVPGTKALAWPNPSAAPFTSATKGLETSGGGEWHPGEGTSYSFPFRLAQAHESVAQDSSLVRHQLWSQGRSGIRLAGLELRPTHPEGSGWEWSLLYGEPGGTYRGVRSQQASDGSIRNYEEPYGDAQGNPFTTVGLVESPITISYAQNAWKAWQGLREDGRVANLLSWGLSGGSFICTYPPSCGAPVPRSTTYSFWGPDPFHRLVIGHSGDRKQSGPIEIYRASGNHDKWLFLDVATGYLVHAVNETEYGGSWVPKVSAVTGNWDSGSPVAATSTPDSGIGRAPLLIRASAVAAPLLAIFLLVYFYPVLKVVGVQLVGFVPGYAKIRKDALLNHPTRDELLGMIRHDPGTTPPRLAAAVGIGFSTAVYHLAVLEKNGLVSSMVDGRHKRFFPVENVHWTERPQIAALKNERTRALYELVRSQPGASQSELAARLGITPPSLKWHVDRLQTAGLLRQERQGHFVRYHTAGEEVPTQALSQLAAPAT